MPPLAPPILPGYLQIAGGYYMIESGSCGGGLIATKSECEAAATALDLSDKTAIDYTYRETLNPPKTSTYNPPGCQLRYSNVLYVYGGGSTGSCYPSQQCICKSACPCCCCCSPPRARRFRRVASRPEPSSSRSSVSPCRSSRYVCTRTSRAAMLYDLLSMPPSQHPTLYTDPEFRVQSLLYIRILTDLLHLLLRHR